MGSIPTCGALEVRQWTFGSTTVWLVNKSAGQPQFFSKNETKSFRGCNFLLVTLTVHFLICVADGPLHICIQIRRLLLHLTFHKFPSSASPKHTQATTPTQGAGIKIATRRCFYVSWGFTAYAPAHKSKLVHANRNSK